MTLVLLTGAAGALGQVLTRGLGGLGYRLRLSDRRQPAFVPPGAEWAPAELNDRAAVMAAAQGVDAIVHFGAIPSEDDFEAILDANIRGTYHVFEAALAAGGARIVFASSNHVIGMYGRDTAIDALVPQRPDSYYGLSKAYGELLGQYYADKHGLDSAALRIGSCVERPRERRHLSTWLSHGDLVRLVDCCLKAPALGAAVFYGVSGNARSWWRDDAAERIGYRPLDNAEDYRDDLPAEAGGDALAEHYQGGSFGSAGQTRQGPAPARVR